MNSQDLSRRNFLALGGAAVAATAAAATQTASASAGLKPKRLPIGLELYSVRDELAKDLMGTVRAVAKMGYEVVEFYSPYFSWTTDYAKEVQKLLADLNIKCHSTHNPRNAFEGDGLKKAIELNQVIGSKSLIMASPGRIDGLKTWEQTAALLTEVGETLKPLGMRAGYHNHQLEFTEKDGMRPIQYLAQHTPKSVTLQFDVGTCMEMGFDPIAWVKANPGRIRSMHLKDWTKGTVPDSGYRVLFGEGDTPWKDLLDTAQKVGGVEYVLLEQEGSRYSAFETAEKCLAAYRKLRE